MSRFKKLDGLKRHPKVEPGDAPISNHLTHFKQGIQEQVTVFIGVIFTGI
jgi:hypothetical protein